MSSGNIVSILALALATTWLPIPSEAGKSVGPPAEQAMQQFEGSFHVSEDNAVISNLEVHGDILIAAKNVTLKNVKLVSDTPWHALEVQEQATGFTLMDSDIDGKGHTVNAIYGFGTFLRNNIRGVDNGINVIGPSVISDNYIHDLKGGADSHYDGIEINGGGHIRIVRNTIINNHGQTSAVMMNNEFGALSDITIDGNLLIGGGYTVYLDGRKSGNAVDDSSIRITNNEIGGGYWGDFAFYINKPVIHGNIGLKESSRRKLGSSLR